MIHAATMVSAGVYMIIRMFPLISLDPKTMTVIALSGLLRRSLLPRLQLHQNDIKRVRAYSTISQAWFMIAALVWAHMSRRLSIWSLMPSSKLCLPRSGRSFMHGTWCFVHGRSRVDPQNMFNMGGLRRKMPITFWTFLIGGFALSGFPL